MGAKSLKAAFFWTTLFAVFFADKIGFLIQDLLRSDPSVQEYIISQVAENGYPLEIHNVTTPDGYILKIHRIPHSPKLPRTSKPKPVVFVQHGILALSDVWLINGVNQSLGFLLADAGYDVWLGNARGNTHSRRHTTLNVNSYEFWDFTWHEIGTIDLPTMIDYTLNATNQDRLHYIGHSQGTTSFFVMASLRPEYNEKIKTMHALSPVAFLGNHKCPIFTIPSYFKKELAMLAKILGMSEFMPNNLVSYFIKTFFCNSLNPMTNMCYFLSSITGGFNPDQANIKAIPVFWTVTPAGASAYQALHYSQLIMSGRFLMYDRGPEENLQRYGQETPPDYPLGNVKAPIFLYVGENDCISTLEDVDILVNSFIRKPNYHKITDKNWSHHDYLWGKKAKELVFDKLIAEMINYDRS